MDPEQAAISATTTNAAEIASSGKRKKTAKACGHCRKAHVTCDESRPCKRCTKRGLSDSCQDHPRKERIAVSSQQQPSSHLAAGFAQSGFSAVNSGAGHVGAPYSGVVGFAAAEMGHALLSTGDMNHVYSQSIPLTQQLFDYKQSYLKLMRVVELLPAADKQIIVDSLSQLNEYYKSISCASKTSSNRSRIMLLQEETIAQMVGDYMSVLEGVGTPTAIWRRTGDLLYASREFQFIANSLLPSYNNSANNMGLNDSPLVEYEKLNLSAVMDSQSLAEYWRHFSHICIPQSYPSLPSSFIKNESNGSLFKTTLKWQSLGNLGADIKCMCSISVKRDASGMPLVIIGQFLPILRS